MSDDDKIIPFGKYKGQEIEQVMQRDPQWVRWIMQQAWFQQKYPTLNQVVINVFAPPSADTPEHNAMQVRFLEDEYRAAFWRAADLVAPDEHKHLLSCFRENTKGLRQAPRPYPYRRQMRHWGKDDGWRLRSFKEHRDGVRTRWRGWRIVHNEQVPIETAIGKPKFEGVTDVIFPVTLSAGRSMLAAIGQSYHAPYSSYRLGIEIKPCVGDDFPAVLRQIKRQIMAAKFADDHPTHWLLLIGEFTATNVTIDQVREIFALDDIKVLLVADVREQLIKLQRGQHG